MNFQYNQGDNNCSSNNRVPFSGLLPGQPYVVYIMPLPQAYLHYPMPAMPQAPTTFQGPF